MNFEEFVEEINLRVVDLSPKEKENICTAMYDDMWSVKDTVNHIKSVRDFNKKQGI